MKVTQRPALYRPIKLAVYPRSDANPYLDLFYGAVAPYGAERAGCVAFTQRWLEDHASEYDAVHFHWSVQAIWRRYVPAFTGHWRVRQVLSLLDGRDAQRWRGRFSSRLRHSLGIRMLDRFLTGLRERGVHVIWTVHDLEPHGASSPVDQRGNEVIARHSDLIISHTKGTREESVRRYRPRCELVVMPHGNYEGVYPPARARTQVLREVGLDPSKPVVCCLGYMRGYKGLDLACEAVARCEGVQLLIAGTVCSDFAIDDLRRRAVSHGRTVLVERRISDQEYSDFAAASDAMLLPYRKITGSGALLAAWTLGRGVIASDLAFFREMIPDGSAAGVLFRREDPEALAAAIERYLSLPAERRREAARAMAERYSWDQCVLPVVEVLQKWYAERTSAAAQAPAVSASCV